MKIKCFHVIILQINYLEEWSLLDRDHSSSLSGAIEALKASTLRLPVVGGAKVCSDLILVSGLNLHISED